MSGMKNRFECLIQGLRAAGDDVMVFTPDRNPPRKYFGAKVLIECEPGIAYHEAWTLASPCSCSSSHAGCNRLQPKPARCAHSGRDPLQAKICLIIGALRFQLERL